MMAQGDHVCRLLALPAELRMHIYSALFTHDEPIEIRRIPISLYCERDQRWFTLNSRENPHDRAHSECQRQIRKCLTSDIYLGTGVRTHSEHYPCPQSIAGCDLDLNLLLSCRQVYWEARKLPYALNTFLTKEVGTFSNFMYCLKTWQVQAMAHLTFEILEKQGMTQYLSEWNDIFALLAASFSALETTAIQVQLYDPISACWNPFWDGGLLALDHLQLKEVKFIIVDGDMQPYFTYSANPSHNQSMPFRECRDLLRLDRGYNHGDNEYLRVICRNSPNPCPLYVPNLIRPLSWYDGSDRMLRHEDILQRDYSAYQYNFEEFGTMERAIFGYQFDATATSKAEIEENTRKLHRSRERLARKLSSQAVELRPRRSQPYHTDANDDTRGEMAPLNSTRINNETPGQWRRLLNEETFAPFFESFPPVIPGSATRSALKLACTGCSESVEAPGCFLHN
ncbi:hypothetical protein Alg130_08684 [Pyrenophora tritici-repentis]|nr:hypothetical protein Alg130_08684 [Pyrenophora tritici-repentis]